MPAFGQWRSLVLPLLQGTQPVLSGFSRGKVWSQGLNSSCSSEMSPSSTPEQPDPQRVHRSRHHALHLHIWFISDSGNNVLRITFHVKQVRKTFMALSHFVFPQILRAGQGFWTPFRNEDVKFRQVKRLFPLPLCSFSGSLETSPGSVILHVIISQLLFPLIRECPECI